MKVAELLEARRPHWQELEQTCAKMENAWRRAQPPAAVARFASLYRAACADLALADAYQFPPATIHYLHQLVGRAHNQLYRSRSFRLRDWAREVFIRVPRRLYADDCLRLAFVVFWCPFLMAAAVAYNNPEFAERIATKEVLEGVESNHEHSVGSGTGQSGSAASGFYIYHNGSIGLRCFAFGLFLGIGGLFETFHNAALLGAVFGHMGNAPQRDNFFEFVTAHGPFELTAIVLMAAAGLRLGFSIVDTGGRTRSESLRRAARRAVPVACVGVVLFIFAAAIEAFLSPTAAPYGVKAAVAILSAMILLCYFVLLGYPGEKDAA
jgi:uncharacterized membrane protein SpoIIM required for sporulation